MTLEILWADAQLWMAAHAPQLAITATALAIILIFERVMTPAVRAGAETADFRAETKRRAIRLGRFILVLIGVLVLAVTWGINLKGVLVFVTTAITLLGVALFAAWSMLSNVTAYFILLLHPSFVRGTFLRVIEGDNFTEGRVHDLTLFNTLLQTSDGGLILYPNNLLLSRVILIGQGVHSGAVGKIVNPPDEGDAPAP